MPVVPMACPKCGKQATEYDDNKWQCLHCGIKFVYKEEKAPVINVHQVYQSGETVRPVMCCPKCGSTNVRLKSLDDYRRGDCNIFGTLLLGDIWNETVQCLACGEMFFTPKGQQQIAERARQKQLESERKAKRARDWEESKKALGTSLAKAQRGVGHFAVGVVCRTDRLLWTMAGGTENTLIHHFLLVLMAGIAVAVLIGLGIMFGR